MSREDRERIEEDIEGGIERGIEGGIERGIEGDIETGIKVGVVVDLLNRGFGVTRVINSYF